MRKGKTLSANQTTCAKTQISHINKISHNKNKSRLKVGTRPWYRTNTKCNRIIRLKQLKQVTALKTESLNHLGFSRSCLIQNIDAYGRFQGRRGSGRTDSSKGEGEKRRREGVGERSREGVYRLYKGGGEKAYGRFLWLYESQNEWAGCLYVPL